MRIEITHKKSIKQTSVCGKLICGEGWAGLTSLSWVNLGTLDYQEMQTVFLYEILLKNFLSLQP